MSDTTVPLLAATEARIAVDGVTAVDRLTLATTGDHVLLAGDTRALFAAITGVPLADPTKPEDEEGELPGEAYVAAGTLTLVGRSVGDRAHLAVMGAAPLDPPLPPRWTVEEYVTWGARLAGASRWTARDLAKAALSRVGLAPARRKRLDTLVRAERRVLLLAQAVVMGPEVLVAEAPLSGMEGAAAAFVMQALLAAGEGRRVLLSAARVDAGSAEGALARGASHLVVLAGGEVAVEGPPGELFAAARVVSLTVRGNTEALRAELSARGIDLRGGPVRFSASLPAGATTREVLAAAAAARAPVVEMVPVLG
ncbi:MAG: ABC transporter ATP-binding protein [Minicystis sp.]